MRRRLQRLDRAEWLRLGGFGAAVAGLHVLGWGLFLAYSRHNPALAGLGTLAYTFGLRHAFDADHIAAIDNTTRKFLQDGKRPLGVGFFFSLGHSTIVFALAAGLAVAAKTVNSRIPTLQHYGGALGAGVSGTFLWIIGVLNLLVLLDIVRVFRSMRHGDGDQEQLELRLLDRGFASRFLGGFTRRVRASWQMYPLGLLFGLGFDTATEVGLLALAAGVATHHVPFLAVISLPLLFAAGMSLMDTADGAFMSQAYGWAFSNPVRKVYYNLTVTTLSVTVALLIGTVELLQVAAGQLALDGAFWRFLAGLDFGRLGFAIVALFVVTWALSIVLWKTRRIEERWSSLAE
jgi:nickel/cobalt transporter (NiCoT) family protein